MNTLNVSNPKVFEGCNYYLMYKTNSSWTCILNKPFILSCDGINLYGQFLSSSWFKEEINKNVDINILIIKLPRRDSSICPDEINTYDMLNNSITEYENNTIEEMNYCLIDFVVAHKCFDKDFINKMCIKIENKINKEDSLETIVYSEYDNVDDAISVKFEINYDNKISKQDINKSNIKYYITTPIFKVNIT